MMVMNGQPQCFNCDAYEKNLSKVLSKMSEMMDQIKILQKMQWNHMIRKQRKIQYSTVQMLVEECLHPK